MNGPDQPPQEADAEHASPVVDNRPIWVPTRRPVLRFITLFAAYMLPFTIFFYAVLTKTDLFQSYLNLNASASAAVLRVFGEEASSVGNRLESPRSSLQIRHGCDAILPTALFLSAVFAFPVFLRLKWTAILLGSSALLVINLVRIITLYYARIYKPDWFHALHVDVWQPAFIFLALFFWVMWALRATKPVAQPQPAVQDH